MKYHKTFLVYLALLSMLGFLATDMYLPAFSDMQQDFATHAGTISASLSLFLAGFACAQLFWGPLSDRIGRKSVIIAGLILFALGCAGMLWVKNTWLMLTLRFIQAAGVCSATVSWQALVVDRYPATQINKVFATIMPLVALSPALAPLLGAWILQHFSWRIIFLVLMTTALLLIICTLQLKSDTRICRSTNLQPGFFTLLASRFYSGNVLIYSACSASFFAWLTGSPFILAGLGLSPSDIGLSYIPQTLAFLAGGFCCRTMLQHFSGKQLLPWLLIVYALSILILLAAALQENIDLILLLLPFCLMALVNGAIYPIVVTNALLPFPQASGKAAALQNTLQLGLCFLASLAVSSWLKNPLLITSSVMSATILITAAGWFWQRSEKARNSIAALPSACQDDN